MISLESAYGDLLLALFITRLPTSDGLLDADPASTNEGSALKYSFFHVVNVEEEFHFARWMAELRNVSLEVLLYLF
jgi:hypothetical protein